MVGLRGSGRHPLSYLEPREPESEAEEDSMATSSEEGQAVGGVVTNNSLDYQAKKAWIQNASFREMRLHMGEPSIANIANMAAIGLIHGFSTTSFCISGVFPVEQLDSTKQPGFWKIVNGTW